MRFAEEFFNTLIQERPLRLRLLANASSHSKKNPRKNGLTGRLTK